MRLRRTGRQRKCPREALFVGVALEALLAADESLWPLPLALAIWVTAHAFPHEAARRRTLLFGPTFKDDLLPISSTN